MASSKTKACKQCRTLVTEGSKCPNCGSRELAESSKGKLIVLKPEESEIAKNVKITKKGAYAIKLG